MARRNKGRAVNGIIVLDKPQGESSNRSLQKVKRLFDAAKAGHTGSLDPLATGVLPLCFGEATKFSQFLLDSDKGYICTIRLGIKTDSGDSEGEVLATQAVEGIEKQDIEQALERFKGAISQVPPMYSALKFEGQPLYKLARQGKTIERQARDVVIFRNEITHFDGLDLGLEIHCSKGTYIRSIADDLGDLLGVGAHITMLRRTCSGPFTLADSYSYEKLENICAAKGMEGLDLLLQAPDIAVKTLPEASLPESLAQTIKQGQAVALNGLPSSGLVRLYQNGCFIGIGEVLEDGRLAPKRLMAVVEHLNQ